MQNVVFYEGIYGCPVCFYAECIMIQRLRVIRQVSLSQPEDLCHSTWAWTYLLRMRAIWSMASMPSSTWTFPAQNKETHANLLVYQETQYTKRSVLDQVKTYSLRKFHRLPQNLAISEYIPCD